MRQVRPGPRNLITDVPGLLVGNSEDHRIKTGTTVVLGERPFVASVDVMGGAPGARETDLLAPDRMIEAVDAIVLSGGSAFGLDAASGVADQLRLAGRGFNVGGMFVPIVPSAIILDLLNGGDKSWTSNPYNILGRNALASVRTDFALGTAGAGTGASTGRLKGGLGSASLVLGDGCTVAALVVANPTGCVTVGDTGHFWAAPFEIDCEFGGLGPCSHPVSFDDSVWSRQEKRQPIASTTLAVVATDATLNKAQAKRFAVSAQDGIARAASPAHTAVDGDLVFAISTLQRPPPADIVAFMHIGHAAAICVARAMARAVYLATPAPRDPLPAWSEKFGTAERRR